MIPPSLQDLLDASLEALRVHPQHALLPIHRKEIYSYLGSISNQKGHRRRARLALSAARYVLPIWQQERPNDDRAERLLTLTENVLHNNVDMQIANEEADEQWWWLEDDDHGGRDVHLSPPAYFAFGAVVKALFAALSGDEWDHLSFNKDSTDADHDGGWADTAQWVVNAVAGPVWEPTSDNEKRREFWTWWLTEAVPAAWNQEP